MVVVVHGEGRGGTRECGVVLGGSSTTRTRRAVVDKSGTYKYT